MRSWNIALFCFYILIQKSLFANSVQVKIEVGTKVMRVLKPEFLSVTLDSSFIRNQFCDIKFVQAIKLGRHLSPAYLRLGGTDADKLFLSGFSTVYSENEPLVDQTWSNTTIGFDRDPTVVSSSSKFCDMFQSGNFKMTVQQWDIINWFVRNTGWRFIFDLNLLSRDESGAWSAKNATALLQYSAKMGYDLDFELGNEPDDYPPDLTMNGTQIVAAFKKLRSVLSTFPSYANSKVYGPDVGHPDNLLIEFLQAGGAKVVDGVTFHHYYGDGHTAVAENFTDPVLMNKLIDRIQEAINWTKKYSPEGSKGCEIWLGETSTMFNGGALALSDRYIAGFMWLDKLGLAASLGLDAVFRQTYVNGNYSLLDENTVPNPDYWLSVLYKRLVGPGVLQLSITASDPAADGHIRFYAHCFQNRVTAFGMNLWNETATITFNADVDTIDQYLMEPKEGNLTSKAVLLNGVELVWDDDGSEFPDLNPVSVQQPVLLPPMRFAFYVYSQECN